MAFSSFWMLSPPGLAGYLLEHLRGHLQEGHLAARLAQVGQLLVDLPGPDIPRFCLAEVPQVRGLTGHWDLREAGQGQEK